MNYVKTIELTWHTKITFFNKNNEEVITYYDGSPTIKYAKVIYDSGEIESVELYISDNKYITLYSIASYKIRTY